MKDGDTMHWRFPSRAEPIEVTLLSPDPTARGWWLVQVPLGGRYLASESELSQLPKPQGDKPGA